MRALVAVAIVACMACGPGGRQVVLAAAAPWHDPVALGTRQGIELAVDEINVAGGAGGRQVTIRWSDDSGTGTHAAVVAESLIADRSVVAVIGHINSGAQVAAAHVYDGRLVALSSQATSPDLSGLSRWIYRVVSSDAANGAGLAHFANTLGASRAAVLYENDIYGRGLAGAFEHAFQGTIVASEPIAAAAASYEPYVSYMRSLRPDVVFVAGLETSGLAVLREAKRQHLAVPFLGGDGWTGLADDAAVGEGAYVGTPFVATDTRPEVVRFVQAFQTRYHMRPDEDAALAYDATRLLAAAIAARGADRRGIRDYLAGLKRSTAFNGITGPITFDTLGDPAGRQFVMTRMHAGSFVPVN
ncbi:MAG TPA: ABC transporter substrate-binding protein [Gemmatimonadaceae bacterium]|nr:ABC transporter substrate-binding protein [Gemmatimonadaceae bacterium]